VQGLEDGRELETARVFVLQEIVDVCDLLFHNVVQLVDDHGVSLAPVLFHMRLSVCDQRGR